MPGVTLFRHPMLLSYPQEPHPNVIFINILHYFFRILLGKIAARDAEYQKHPSDLSSAKLLLASNIKKRSFPIKQPAWKALPSVHCLGYVNMAV